jgi:hypothetical protein
VEIGSLDDFEVPGAGSRYNLCHFRPLIARVCENAFDEGKAPPRSLQQIATTQGDLLKAEYRLNELE